MGGGKKERRRAAATRPIEPVPGSRRPSRTVVLGAAAALAALAIAAGAWWWQSGRPVSVLITGGSFPSRPPASYVGPAACGQGHPQAAQRWRGTRPVPAHEPASHPRPRRDLHNPPLTDAGVA